MKKPQPALPVAPRQRCRGRFQPGSALSIVVAGTLMAAMTAVAAPDLQGWLTETPAKVSTVVAATPPNPPRLAHAGTDPDELAPRAEALAGVVARRYRIARESAREVVRVAYREGGRNDVDPVLILAVVAVESRFNPIAESEQGAVGLMQVIPRLHMDKVAANGGASILLPHANIAVGTRILKESIRRGGTEAAGLQLYNGAADDDTRAYANRVLSERRRLEDAMPRARDRA